MIMIISITKFLIAIGSMSTYLSCKQRAITWVPNYRCHNFNRSYKDTFATAHINYLCFNGFILNISFSYGRHSSLFCSKEILFLIRLISNWTSSYTIQGVIVFVISNWPHNYSPDYSLNCTPLGPITVTLLLIITIIIIIITFEQQLTWDCLYLLSQCHPYLYPVKYNYKKNHCTQNN